MTKRKYGWVLCAVLAAMAFPSWSGAQSSDHRAPTLEGTPGLFLTWDAEPLRPGEVFFSGGAFRYNRDPGSLTVTDAPAALSIGVFSRLEIFGSINTQKRIDATDILTYRIRPGQPPRPAQTPTGETLFSMTAPFIDVPFASGHGDLYGNIKFNLLSQRKGQKFGLSAVGIGKLSPMKTFEGLNRGLTTGDTSVGFGALASERLRNGTQFHANALWSFSTDPTVQGVGISDVHNQFLFRAGTAYPVKPQLNAIGEFQVYNYFGHPVPGLDPTTPVDIVVGIRAFPNDLISFGGGYVASVNHIKEDPARGVVPAPTNGFIVQFTLAFKRD